jgi:hypothetical protein
VGFPLGHDAFSTDCRCSSIVTARCIRTTVVISPWRSLTSGQNV